METAQQIRTQTVVMHPIVAALVAAEEILGPGRVWHGANDEAGRFFDGAFSRSRNEVEHMPEIYKLASWSAEVINKALKERGFEIQLDPFGPNEFGVIGILELLLKWRIAGTRDNIFADDGMFPAVKMAWSNVEVVGLEDHQHPAILLPTTSGDEIYLTMIGKGLSEVRWLRDIGHTIVEQGGKKQPVPRDGNTFVKFPMVDLDVKTDITWLLQTFTYTDGGKKSTIVQALQQTMLAMDHLGAMVKSGVAVKSCMESMPHGLVIDKPFYAVVNRPGLNEPIFTGLIGQEHWKAPKR